MSFRRPLGAVLVMASLSLAVGCGASDKNYDKIRSTPYTGSVDAGSIAVRGIRIVPSESGAATGFLIASLANRGGSPDTLTNATVAGGAVTPNGVSDFTIEPTHTLQFSTPDVGGTDAATLEITASPTPLTIGTTVPVTFTFDTAGSVQVDVPVKSPEQVGSTATAAPIVTTGSYPTPSETPATEP